MDRSLEWLVTVFIAHAIFESLFELILFLLDFHEEQNICKDLDCLFYALHPFVIGIQSLGV